MYLFMYLIIELLGYYRLGKDFKLHYPMNQVEILTLGNSCCPKGLHGGLKQYQNILKISIIKLM